MELPPLVTPADELPAGERDRAARQLRLPELGEPGQRRLYAARVGVLGAGGLGSPVLLYLASAGVGTIGIVDDDVVDASNLQRQVIFSSDDVGTSKAGIAADRIRSLSPHTTVIEHREHLTADNAEQIFAGYDLIIDGSDTFDTRYAVADACAALGIPLVWGSVLRFDAQATVFWSRPPSGPAVTLRDVFPTAPAPGEVPSCAEAGVLGALCGQLGGILVTEAVKLICGIGDSLLGRMLVLEALSQRTREVPLAPVTPDTGSAAPVAETAHADSRSGAAPEATQAHANARQDATPDAASAAPGAAPEGVRDTAAPAPSQSSSTRQAGRPAHVAIDDLAAHDGAMLLDVREPEEFSRGSIPGAVSVPLAQVLGDAASIRLDDSVIVFCQTGPRARAAARALTAAHPETDIRLLDGGYAAWSERSRV
ncbi:ThiF family adenylyltransferase [Microbacterium sp. MPKO10]|uniref:ThiF family adenylyltransferase n=1 Tax=Microbacterium sp. MPKO10 TaxID=2989818 RepID=UPI0022357BF1|nr:ThiF family adenylyltransferase [Microbacterium sp. MPKO10]MCW4458693.1 ThiF family adenylyltransferase [Microbacterium sp. MPKO10]